MNNTNSELRLPPMLSGTELLSALQILPTYDPKIKYQDAATRLIALSDLYRLYLPSQMSVEIYSKLYLALLRSLQKKHTMLSRLHYREHCNVQTNYINRQFLIL